MTMKHAIKTKYLTIVISSFIFTASMSALLFAAPHVSGASDTTQAPTVTEIAEENTYKTTTVTQKESSNLLLPGKVLSHESATIYPRRAGIVKDIYLDIGDPVREGQVIGVLLPQGVEGESAALIAEKAARARQAKANYLNAKRVADVAIENAERQLVGKEGEAENGIASKITNAKKNVEVARSNLKLSQDTLEKRQIDIENTLRDAKHDLTQEKDQIKNIVDSSFNPVDSMISSFDTKPSTQRIDLDDLPNYLGAAKSSTKNSFIRSYNVFIYTKEELDAKTDHTYDELNQYIEASLDLAAKSEDLLRNSIGNQKLSSSQMSSYTSDILAKKNQVLAQKEAYEDAFNAYNNTLSSTDETITRLANQVEKDQRQLEYTVDVLNNATTLATDNLSIVRANEQRRVDQAETELAVAQAAVNVEYSKSGHMQIVSPFTGIIAKRHVAVGDLIAASNPLFELVGVQTALSKKSRQEIKFGIDEQYYSLINIGDQIEFYIPQKETTTYLATITRISPQIDPETHNILVQANIDTDISLPNHMNIRVTIPRTQEIVYEIPSMLIKEEDGTNYVWILEDDTHIKLIVDVIAEDGELAEVTGELSEETLLITSAPDSFLNTEKND